MKAAGSKVVPVNMSENIQSSFTAINLKVLAVPPYNKTIGLWNLELEYQIWNSSRNPTNYEWKRVTWFNHTDPVTLVVHKNSKFSSIQAAVDSAKPGSVIIVNPGHYIEDVHITKPLRLLTGGEDSHRTHIFGQLLIHSSNVTVDGFQFHTLNLLKSSLVVVNSSSVSIQNCKFQGDRELKFLSPYNHHMSAFYLQNSVNLYLINSIFKDCSIGLAIENCSDCNIVGNSFSSCLTGLQTSSSDGIRIVSNYLVKNLIALKVNDSVVFEHLLDENVFEKNSAVIKNDDKLFSRTDLEVMTDHPLGSKEQPSFSEGPKLASEVLIYGSCEMELEQDRHFQSPNLCIYISGEFISAQVYLHVKVNADYALSIYRDRVFIL